MAADDPGRLITSLVAGSPQAAARLISILENDGAAATAAFRALFPHTGRAHIVGITGPPGSGKSTLVNVVIKHLRQQGQRVGVVAVDPTSPFTGGALLGDRIRMVDHSTDPQVFVRSMATRGSLGGLAPATGEAIAVLDAWGAATVLIETVGTGQAEIDVVSVADTVVLVTTPGLGDGVQTIKAGVMEIGDVFVVNKADRPDVDRTVTELKMMVGLTPDRGWRAPVLTTVATTGEGVAGLLDAIRAHRRHQESTGQLAARRRARWRREIVKTAEAHLQATVLRAAPPDALEALAEEVASGALDPRTATERLLAGDVMSAAASAEAAPATPAPAVGAAAAPIVPDLTIDHIGIAVRSIEAASRFYRDVLGLTASPPEYLPTDGVIAAFVAFGDTRVELLEPAGPESAIARFLERRGEGIHHIAVAVPDVARSLDAARAAGFLPIDERPRAGARGSRIAFLQPKGTSGVLIELVSR
jgi:LAO/AO transport system kinase